MLGLQYAGRVIAHWREHHPSLYRSLKAEGQVNAEAQRVSREAAEQVAALMKQGMPHHQAEELVLPETVYAPPARVGLDDE